MAPLEIGYLVVAAAVDIPILYYVGRWLFGGWDGFVEAIVFWFTPDAWSFFRGEFWDDAVAEFKLLALIAVVAALGFSEYRLFLDLFR